MPVLSLCPEFHDTADRTELPAPTACPPGSQGKIAELCRRFAAGQQLWNPEDDDHVQHQSAVPNKRRAGGLRFIALSLLSR